MTTQTVYMTRHPGESMLLSFEYDYNPVFYEICHEKNHNGEVMLSISSFDIRKLIKAGDELELNIDILNCKDDSLKIIAPIQKSSLKEPTAFKISIQDISKHLFKIEMSGNLSAMHIHRKEIWLRLVQGVDFDKAA